MDKISVVIPFFQKKSGVLHRCLSSILSQTWGGKIEVLVVDDESPISPVLEVEKLPSVPPNITIRIVRQNNSGPGSARNRGLDEVKGTDAIALLDSDDAWAPDHLARAALALGQGFQLYGSNWTPNDSSGDAYSVRKFDVFTKLEYDSESEGGRLKCSVLEQQIKRPIFKLSTIVFDAYFFEGVRFDEDLRHASEDLLFTVRLGSFDPKAYLSNRVEVTSGKGVNIYESVEFGTEKNIYTISDQIVGRKRMKSLISGESLHLQKHLNEAIRNFGRLEKRNILACIKRGRLLALPVFFRQKFTDLYR